MADWWPDWRGETVVIVASGPSQRREDAALLDLVVLDGEIVAFDRVRLDLARPVEELTGWDEWKVVA